MAYQVYGRYVTAARHSILRRPFYGTQKYAQPASIYDSEAYLAHIVAPHTIVLEPKYCVQLSRSRSVDGAVTLVCTSISRPSMYYIPPNWCFTKYGGVFCDYAATLIAPSLTRPSMINEYTSAVAELTSLPTFTESTGYLVDISHLPVEIMQESYDVAVKPPSVIQVTPNYVVISALPHIIESITGHNAYLEALPKYADQITITAELMPLVTYSMSARYSTGYLNSVARANVQLVTYTAVSASRVPIDKALPVSLTTFVLDQPIETAVLSGSLMGSSYAAIFRPSMATLTSDIYIIYPYVVLSSRYMPYTYLLINKQNIYNTSRTKHVVIQTPPNLLVTSYALDVPSLAYEFKAWYVRYIQPVFVMTNLSSYTISTYNTLNSYMYRSSYGRTININIRYSPIIVDTIDAVRLVHTPAWIFKTSTTSYKTYPYVVLSSRYNTDIYISYLFITGTNINTITQDRLYAYKFIDNLHEYTRTGYAQLPHITLMGSYAASYGLVMAPQYIGSVSYTAMSPLYKFDQNVYALTQTAVSAQHMLVYPVQIAAVTATSTSFRPVYKVFQITQSAAGMMYARHIYSATSTAVSAQHSYAVPIHISAVTPTSAIFLPIYKINQTTSTSYIAKYAMRIIARSAEYLAGRYTSINLLSLSATSYAVSHIAGNVIQSDAASYLLYIAPQNAYQQDASSYLLGIYAPDATQADGANYTVNISRYGTLQQDQASYALSVLAPNTAQQDQPSYALSIMAPNVVQRDGAYQSLSVLAPNTREADGSSYSVIIKPPNVAQSDASSYALKIYRVLTLSQSSIAATRHKVGLYLQKNMAVASNATTAHAVKFAQSQITLYGTAEVEYGGYVA
jgi:hypothetical protein